jgi:nitrite reductase/ring-hydroxylating ferredoxin subunit
MSDTPSANPEAQWHAVGAAADWKDDAGRLVTIGARRIGVYKHEGGWYALKDVCPHAGVPLSHGPVFDGGVMCVGHGWRFSLKTGEWIGGSSGYKVATYPVRVREDGVVEVAV